MAAPEISRNELQAEMERLRDENHRLRHQRDNLALIASAQSELLHEIVQDYTVIDRKAWADAAPALADAPAPPLRALVALMGDLTDDGATAHAWTGVDLGTRCTLVKATRSRLVGPLEDAGMVAPAGGEGYKALRYRLRPAANITLSARVDGLTSRYHSVMSDGFATGTVLVTSGGRTETSRSHSVKIANITPPQRDVANNTLPRRDVRLVCLSDDPVSLDQETDQDHQTDNAAPAWNKIERRLIHDEWRDQGFSKALKKSIEALPADQALALVLHVKANATRSPGGLANAMLKAGDQADPAYLTEARGKISLRQRAKEQAGQFDLAPETPPQARNSLPLPPAPPKAPRPPELDEPIGDGPLTVAAVWLGVMNQLQAQLNQTTYSQQIEGTQAERYEDGTLWVKLRQRAGRQWLSNHQNVVDRIATRIAGTALAVRCVEDSAGIEKPGPDAQIARPIPAPHLGV